MLIKLLVQSVQQTRSTDKFTKPAYRMCSPNLPAKFVAKPATNPAAKPVTKSAAQSSAQFSKSAAQFAAQLSKSDRKKIWAENSADAKKRSKKV